jgi:hypothetical protein
LAVVNASKYSGGKHASHYIEQTLLVISTHKKVLTNHKLRKYNQEIWGVILLKVMVYIHAVYVSLLPV